jgi:hypothetical protein
MFGFESYMKAVKKELGLDGKGLVFIGMADVALVWWCEQKSVYQNRRMEPWFFMSFLTDILSYAKELGYIDRKIEPPAKELLTIRRRISFNDIEKLLKERGSSVEHWPVIPLVEGLTMSSASKLKDLIVSGAPPLKVIEEIKHLPPKVQGEILECYSEKYPTIRWNFDWEDYVIVGVPDGITDRFVYEYKTAGSKWLLEWIKPVAMAQADIYGHFFRREEKRVQIMNREDGEIHTWHEGVDGGVALNTLRRFREVEKGERKATPPARWKCKHCEFRSICTI